MEVQARAHVRRAHPLPAACRRPAAEKQRPLLHPQLRRRRRFPLAGRGADGEPVPQSPRGGVPAGKGLRHDRGILGCHHRRRQRDKARQRGHPHGQHGGLHLRAGHRDRAAHRSARRDLHLHPHRHEGLLQQARGDRLPAAPPRRRPAVGTHRRYRLHGRGRLCVSGRPHQAHHHPARRLQGVPLHDRKRHQPPPRRAPVLRGGPRRYRPHPGTSALRLCGAGACRHRQKAPDPAGAAPAVPGGAAGVCAARRLGL